VEQYFAFAICCSLLTSPHFNNQNNTLYLVKAAKMPGFIQKGAKHILKTNTYDIVILSSFRILVSHAKKGGPCDSYSYAPSASQTPTSTRLWLKIYTSRLCCLSLVEAKLIVLVTTR
jgi:hypothetical protein